MFTEKKFFSIFLYFIFYRVIEQVKWNEDLTFHNPFKFFSYLYLLERIILAK